MSTVSQNTTLTRKRRQNGQANYGVFQTEVLGAGTRVRIWESWFPTMSSMASQPSCFPTELGALRVGVRSAWVIRTDACDLP